MMSEKRFSVDDDGIYDTQEKKHFKFIAYDWMECDIYECCEKLNELSEENEQLRTQLLICQQSKSDDGRIKVWQVPPISKGMRITSFTTSDGEIDE